MSSGQDKEAHHEELDWSEYKGLNFSDLRKKISETHTLEDMVARATNLLKIGKAVYKNPEVETELQNQFGLALHQSQTEGGINNIVQKYTSILKGKGKSIEPEIDERVYDMFIAMQDALKIRGEKETYLFGQGDKMDRDNALYLLRMYVSHLDEQGKDGATWRMLRKEAKEGRMDNVFQIIREALKTIHVSVKKDSLTQELIPEDLDQEFYSALDDRIRHYTPHKLLTHSMARPSEARRALNLWAREEYNGLKATYGPKE